MINTKHSDPSHPEAASPLAGTNAVNRSSSPMAQGLALKDFGLHCRTSACLRPRW